MTEGPPLADAVRGLVLATERFRADRSRRHGLTPTAMTALAQLHLSGPLPVGELARHLDIGAAAATEVIDKLEHVGAATRSRHPRDRRKLVVSLTEHGNWVIADVYDQFTTRIAWAAEGLDAESRERFTRFATAAREHLLLGTDTSASSRPGPGGTEGPPSH